MIPPARSSFRLCFPSGMFPEFVRNVREAPLNINGVEASLMEEAARSGAFNYLVKPVTRESLAAAVTTTFHTKDQGEIIQTTYWVAGGKSAGPTGDSASSASSRGRDNVLRNYHLAGTDDAAVGGEDAE